MALLLVHGKDVSRATELGGNFVRLAAALNNSGFAVLMIDLRGHGQSGDAHLSFGIDERRDIAGAVDWLKGQGFQARRIGVLGISMGAATAIGAAAEDQDIGAVVADSGYAEIYPVIEQNWRAASGLPSFFLPSTRIMGRLLLGYDLASAQPVAEIGKVAPRPVLIIHNVRDRLIPVNHARRLAAAYPLAETWEVADGEHAQAYFADPQAYTDRVATFFRRSLN